MVYHSHICRGLNGKLERRQYAEREKGAFDLLNFLYAEVNAVGIVVLLLMLTSRNRKNFAAMPGDQQIFNCVMFLNLLIFLFDTGMWLADGASFPVLKTVNYIVTTCYYLLNPLICFLWLLYTDYKINESKTGLLRRIRFYVFPVAVCTVMTLASPLTGWFFVIDEGNRYSRGPLFPVISILSLVYLVFACGITLADIRKNGWEATKSVNFPLVVFPAGIMVATAIQIRFFGISIIWVCTMLACSNIYINLQNTEISTDYLTGLYNRRRLDQHLQRRIGQRRSGRLLFAMMLDLDEFKKINDKYGHMEGDRALIRVAELLRQSCKKGEDFIARMGGDEFIIVGERSGAGEIEQLMVKLNANAADSNKTHPLKYTLTLSMGYSVFREGDTEDSFFAAADREMYCCKQKRKAATVKEHG